ncbi:MAG: hypothetical protein R6V06_06945 [Kiritimatiellia bacterium]
MYIDEFNEVIENCRFCLMCRHLDPVGNVSFREADTPRGRALIADSIRMDPGRLENSDYIETMYRSALSGANRTHCVSSYDEIGLVLALRRDIVEAGFAPENVKALAEQLSSVSFKVSGQAEFLYFGEKPELYPDCVSITGGDPGKALEVLGFYKESRKVLSGFKKAVDKAGCKTLVVAEPSAYHFLSGRLDGVKVLHSSEYLLQNAKASGKAGEAVYLESDFLKNYCENSDSSKELLTKCGWKLLSFGPNSEESCAAGEGAVVFDELNPDVCRRLCRRVVELAGDSEKKPFITASGYVKRVFSKYEPDITVLTVEDVMTNPA